MKEDKMSKSETLTEHVNIMEWLTKGLSISILPALAYFLEFKYEQGYCANFGLPSSLIKPDITTALIFFSALWGLSTILVFLIDSWITLTEEPQEGQTAFEHFFRLYGPIVTLLLLFASIYGGRFREWMWVGIIVLVFTASDFILAAINRDKVKPFLLQLRGPAHFFVAKGTEYAIVRSRFGAGVFVIFLVMSIGSQVCTALGNAEALSQKTFLTPSTHPDMVVVRIYGDRAICCQIDRKLKKPLRTFAVIQFGKDTSTVFSAEDVGPLIFR